MVSITTQVPSAQPTNICCLVKSALAAVRTWLQRSGMGIGAWQTIDRDAQPDPGSKEPHGLRIPCVRRSVSRPSESGGEFPAVSDSKLERYESAMGVNLLLTLKDVRALDCSVRAAPISLRNGPRTRRFVAWNSYCGSFARLFCLDTRAVRLTRGLPF